MSAPLSVWHRLATGAGLLVSLVVSGCARTFVSERAVSGVILRVVRREGLFPDPAGRSRAMYRVDCRVPQLENSTISLYLFEPQEGESLGHVGDHVVFHTGQNVIPGDILEPAQVRRYQVSAP